MSDLIDILKQGELDFEKFATYRVSASVARRASKVDVSSLVPTIGPVTPDAYVKDPWRPTVPTIIDGVAGPTSPALPGTIAGICGGFAPFLDRRGVSHNPWPKRGDGYKHADVSPGALRVMGQTLPATMPVCLNEEVLDLVDDPPSLVDDDAQIVDSIRWHRRNLDALKAGNRDRPVSLYLQHLRNYWPPVDWGINVSDYYAQTGQIGWWADFSLNTPGQPGHRIKQLIAQAERWTWNPGRFGFPRSSLGLTNAMDWISWSVYPFYAPQHGTPEEDEQIRRDGHYVRFNLRLARHIAGGKPVCAFVNPHVHFSSVNGGPEQLSERRARAYLAECVRLADFIWVWRDRPNNAYIEQFMRWAVDEAWKVRAA